MHASILRDKLLIGPTLNTISKHGHLDRPPMMETRPLDRRQSRKLQEAVIFSTEVNYVCALVDGFSMSGDWNHWRVFLIIATGDIDLETVAWAEPTSRGKDLDIHGHHLTWFKQKVPLVAVVRLEIR